MGRSLDVAACAGLLLLAGCTRSTKPPAAASLDSATLVEACALGVPGTRVETRETAEEFEITFMTVPSRVDELRLRVRDQAHAYGPYGHRGQGHLGEHRGTRDHGLRLWALSFVRTRADDTASGAKLTIMPTVPAADADMRRFVRERVAHIQAAGCM